MTRTRNIFKQNCLKYVGIINVKKNKNNKDLVNACVNLFDRHIHHIHIIFFFLLFFTFLTLQNNIIFKHNLRLEIHTTYKPPPPHK